MDYVMVKSSVRSSAYFKACKTADMPPFYPYLPYIPTSPLPLPQIPLPRISYNLLTCVLVVLQSFLQHALLFVHIPQVRVGFSEMGVQLYSHRTELC